MPVPKPYLSAVTLAGALALAGCGGGGGAGGSGLQPVWCGLQHMGGAAMLSPL